MPPFALAGQRHGHERPTVEAVPEADELLLFRKILREQRRQSPVAETV
jgi:hypothetical protein